MKKPIDTGGPAFPVPNDASINNQMNLPRALYAVRKFYDIKQSDVSFATGLTRSCINNYEKGIRKIPVSYVEEFAKYLRIRVSTIFMVAEYLDNNDHNPSAAHAQAIITWVKATMYKPD